MRQAGRYYAVLNAELTDSGELVEQQALTGPELAKVVTSGGVTAPVVTDGPFVEFKEMLATEHVLRPGYDFGDEFDFGLDLILDPLATSIPDPAV
jgi:hypothetical protein